MFAFSSSMAAPISAHAEIFHLATGLGTGWFRRADFGSGTSERLMIEPVLHAYFPFGDSPWQFKSSVSLSVHFDQQEMPRAIQVKEQDWALGIGAGVAYNWVYVPSITLGAQYVARTIALESQPPVNVAADDISDFENLFGAYVQFGVGVPILEGRILFEPFYRYRRLISDDRDAGAYGVETTWLIF